MHKTGPHSRHVASGDACMLYLSVCIILHSNREIPSVPRGRWREGGQRKSGSTCWVWRLQFSFSAAYLFFYLLKWRNVSNLCKTFFFYLHFYFIYSCTYRKISQWALFHLFLYLIKYSPIFLKPRPHKHTLETKYKQLWLILHAALDTSILTKRFWTLQSRRRSPETSFEHQHLSRATGEASIWQMCDSNNGLVSICTRLPCGHASWSFPKIVHCLIPYQLDPNQTQGPKCLRQLMRW